MGITSGQTRQVSARFNKEITVTASLAASDLISALHLPYS